MIKDENCVFCKIIANELPSYKVYEDENLFGFLTIRPHKKGHMLLIPKNHSEDIVEMDSEDYEKLFAVAKDIAGKIKEIFSAPRVSLVTMGLAVAHTHLHILPISEESDLNLDMAYDISKEEATEVQGLYKFS